MACEPNLTALVDIITSLNVGGLGEAFLVDGDGKVLVSSHKDQVLKTLKDVFPEQPLGLTAGFHETVQGGDARLVNFTPVQGLPSVKWYLGLSINQPRPSHRSPKHAIWPSLPPWWRWLRSPCCCLLIRVLLRPLHDLTRAMDDIAEGGGDQTRWLPVQGRDEFGALAEAFHHFVAWIHTSIRNVAQSTDDLSQGTRRVLQAM